MNLYSFPLPLLYVCSPAPALLAARRASAPAGRKPTVPGSPCWSQCVAALSGCCRDPEHPRDAAPASGHPAGLAPTAGLAGAPHVQDAPSPQSRLPPVEGSAEEEENGVNTEEDKGGNDTKSIYIESVCVHQSTG